MLLNALARLGLPWAMTAALKGLDGDLRLADLAQLARHLESTPTAP
ncbi:hypothetical protein O7614_25490 [Micromonospora sp. WMMD961]|nr:hypothetical protein [Micromonospora sp. WMMD961]MDG4783023.1 hypothetical protein [Micromonospora sp. WMMD961]